MLRVNADRHAGRQSQTHERKRERGRERKREEQTQLSGKFNLPTVQYFTIWTMELREIHFLAQRDQR